VTNSRTPPVLVGHSGSVRCYTQKKSSARGSRTHQEEDNMTDSQSRRELPIYLGHAEPIGMAFTSGKYIPGRETDALRKAEKLLEDHLDMLAPRRGLKRWFGSAWHPRTKRWKKLVEQLDTLLIERIGTTEVLVESTRQLDSREILRARLEYLTEVIKRARYRTWRNWKK